MSTDELFCRWAEAKYGIGRVTRVDFEHDEGWGGTDVTPGDPARVEVYVEDGAGHRRCVESDLEVLPALIREIAEFALKARG